MLQLEPKATAAIIIATAAAVVATLAAVRLSETAGLPKISLVKTSFTSALR